jgi:predicted ATPase/CYTH domain-containing protein
MIQEKIQSARNSEKLKEAKNDKYETDSQIDRHTSYVSAGSTHQPRMKENTLDHSKVIGSSKYPVIRICLTGGPCAGKTTALSTLNTYLTNLNFRVLIVPEAATMLMKGGAMIMTHKLSFADAVKFQINVMRA